jgi:hypothetical protein
MELLDGKKISQPFYRVVDIGSFSCETNYCAATTTIDLTIASTHVSYMYEVLGVASIFFELLFEGTPYGSVRAKY